MALAQQRGLSGLTAESGQHIFREVLGGRTRSGINVPMSQAEHAKYAVKTIPPPTEKFRRDTCLSSVSSCQKLPAFRITRCDAPQRCPVAWILERMVNAGLMVRQDASSVSSVVIQDAIFHRFVRYSAAREPNIRVVAEETPNEIALLDGRRRTTFKPGSRCRRTSCTPRQTCFSRVNRSS